MTNSTSRILRRLQNQQEQTLIEEQQQVIERAGRMDQLVSNPCWNRDILPIMVDIVNRQLEDSVSASDREKKLEHVIRWDAARDLVDRVRNYIEQTREERDRLIKEQQETESNVDTGNYA